MTERKLNILLIGGTGAMGEHLTEILASQGHAVTVTTRKLRKNRTNVKYIQGDAKSLSFLREILNQRYNAIVDFMSYSTAQFLDRYELLLSSTDQLVYLSSSRVYADSLGPITEDSNRLIDVCDDDKYLASDEYALGKGRQENILRKSDKRNWTIIRPYITYSEYRLQLGVLEKEDWLYRALKGRPIVFSKDIANCLTTLTYGYDVANSISAIIGNPNVLGESIHITQKNCIKWEDVLTIYLCAIKKATGKCPRYRMLDVAPNLNNDLRKYQVKYDRLFDRCFDNKRISEYIDTDSFVSPVDGLTKCVGYFVNHPKFGKIDWRAEALRDRLTGSLAKPTEMSAEEYLKYLVYRFIMPRCKLY